MSAKYFKSLPKYSNVNTKVDRENGILRDTIVAEEGDNLNDSYFDGQFLQALVKMGNADERGIKSRFNHPNMCGGAFGTYIGRYKNFSYRENGAGGKMCVFADLYLDPVTKKQNAPNGGITVYDYVMDMAETNPDMFGNSIVIYSKTFEGKVGEDVKTMHLLEKFKGCDLVDDPAATSSLFDTNGQKDLGIIITEFLDSNPEVFDVIDKDPKLMGMFFERYGSYFQRKSKTNFNMSNFRKLLHIFSTNKKFDIDLTLADGSIVKVITEAEQPAQGDEVQDQDGNPVADGEHLLPDGSSIVTAGGKITEIKEAPGADPAGEPTMEQVMSAVNRLTQAFDSFKKAQEAKQKDNDQAFDLLGTQLQKFQSETTTKLSTITSQYQVPPAGDPVPGKGKSGYDPEKAKELRQKNQ